MSRVKIAQQGCRCKNSQRAKNLTPLDFGKLFGFVKQFILEFEKIKILPQFLKQNTQKGAYFAALSERARFEDLAAL